MELVSYSESLSVTLAACDLPVTEPKLLQHKFKILLKLNRKK